MNDSSFVYSTGRGRMCPACERPVANCVCRRAVAGAPAGAAVKVSRETKGRKGKCVTVIAGLPLDAAALEILAKQFKRKCGCGGTVRDGVIEIQGDHRDALVAQLTRSGYKAKKSGG